MSRGRYHGGGLSLVDDKARVAIPASLRGTLLANTPGIEGKGGGQIFLGVHPEDRCIMAFEPGYLALHDDKLDEEERRRMRDDGRVDYNIKRSGGLGGETMPFDASGRFILPGFPKFHAEIGGHAFFWGAVDHIEIWNPKIILETPGLSPTMVSMCRYALHEKGIAL